MRIISSKIIRVARPRTCRTFFTATPTAPAAFWASAPLQYFNQGTGLIIARNDWNYNSTWVAFQLGNLLETDHQQDCQGQLEIQRGADGLLINANAVGENQLPSTQSSFGNLMVIDDNGVGTQVYRFNQGSWFGTPGCVMTSYEPTNGYVYAGGDYAASYGFNFTPGIGTAKKLTRQIVYLRPDYIVVHDRAVTKSTNDLKQLRWHFLNSPTFNASSNSWVETEGSSKLFGQTFSRSTLLSSNAPVRCPDDPSGALVYRITTQNAVKATNVTYVTALQSAPSTTNNMVNTAPVYSSDNRMEGVQMGNNLVLFGADAPLNPFTGTITYTVTGSSPIVHLLTDLQPNHAFQVSAGGISMGTFTSFRPRHAVFYQHAFRIPNHHDSMSALVSTQSSNELRRQSGPGRTSLSVLFDNPCSPFCCSRDEGTANPTVGAHTFTNYNLGENGNLSISTPALNTQPSGSTMLVCIGRGNISAFTQVPTDNKGNTPYVQLGSTHGYVPQYPDSGTALYAFPSAVGGTGHVVTVSTVAQDEVTLDAVEIKNGGVIQDYKWNEVLQGHPLTSLDVTTTGPATLVAFWWGDGNQYFVHTAIPDNGFTLIDSLGPLGSYVQTAVATRDVTTAGTYHVTWDSGGNEGAQLWLVAVQSEALPVLRAQVFGSHAVITWPSSAVGYTLETTSDLPASNSWTRVTNSPAIVNLRNTITNLISQGSHCYRLRK